MSKSELIAACRDGDRDAWEAFLKQFGHSIRAIAARILKREGCAVYDADEVLQLVLIDLWSNNRFAKLKEPIAIHRYVNVTAASKAYDYVRIQRRAEKVSGIQGNEPPDPANELLRQEKSEAISRLLKRLSTREVFMLKMSIMEDLTHRQIAEMLLIPQDTVSSVIRRARIKLKNMLAERGFEDV